MDSSLDRLLRITRHPVQAGGRLAKSIVKTSRRWRDPERSEATRWARKHEKPAEEILGGRFPAIWSESLQIANETRVRRTELLRERGLPGARSHEIGGGPGNLEVLYTLIRVLKPLTVIETGVASGASSQVILGALNQNDRGQLLSSDLALMIPPDQAGLCVEPQLHGRWTLLQDGDRKNLPSLLESIQSLDVFHYDSVKSYEDMAWAVELVKPKMHKKSVLLLDDVDRHSFFSDYVHTAERSWFIFGTLGVIGLDEAFEASVA